MTKIKNRRKTLDELASNLSPETLQSHGLTMNDGSVGMYPQQRQDVASPYNNVTKSQPKFVQDFTTPAPPNFLVLMGKIADKNPANLNKGLCHYQNRMKYTDEQKKIKVGGIPLAWTDEEIEEMEKIEKSEDRKFKDFIKW